MSDSHSVCRLPSLPISAGSLPNSLQDKFSSCRANSCALSLGNAASEMSNSSAQAQRRSNQPSSAVASAWVRARIPALSASSCLLRCRAAGRLSARGLSCLWSSSVMVGFPGVDGGGIVVFSDVGRGRFAGGFSIFIAWRPYPPPSVAARHLPP